MDWKKFQDEVREWSCRNFGDGPRHRSILGLIEELGELFESYDIRGDHEAQTRRIDAIGDTMIYMADFCGKTDRDLSYIVRSGGLMGEYPHGLKPRALITIVGRLSHHQLKLEQGIRNNEDHESCITTILSEVVYTLICHVPPPHDLQEVVQGTWDRVSKRDWVANPDNAHEVADAALEPPASQAGEDDSMKNTRLVCPVCGEGDYEV